MIQNFIKTKSNSDLLCKTILGLEREAMRTDSMGNLSLTPHPENLGSALTHPLIKTDFCEAQVEYATKSSHRIESVLRSLGQLHAFTTRNLDEEFLWPFSMPPALPDKEEEIPLALYGNTKDAMKKTIYRRGLGFRYGRRMQTISGVHINISFSKYLMNWASQTRYSQELSQDTQTQLYLDTIRNFNRYSFLLVYLFGASPAMDKSFCKKIAQLEEWESNTWYGKGATSLRLSELGYTSQVQNTLPISFNNIEEYTKGLCYAISTVFPSYTKYNNRSAYRDRNQLNDYYLQIENEYYALIRPKQIPDGDERPIDSLSSKGIRYLEIRCVDSDPFHPLGVTRETIAFNQLFLLYCLLSHSPFMDENEKKDWDANQYKAVWSGRDLNTKYQIFDHSKTIKEAFYDIYSDLLEVAEFWDKRESCSQYRSTLYRDSLAIQKAKIDSVELTPSHKILSELKRNRKSFLEYGLELGAIYKKDWMDTNMEPRVLSKMVAMAKQSLEEKIQLEKSYPLEDSPNRNGSSHPNLVSPAEVCS